MKATTRQKFTAEFREQAVKLITEQGLKISEAARRLDISDKSLSRWVIAAKQGQLDKIDAKRLVPVSALEAEVSKLRKENAVLREEREILKKATAFFAKESR
jgi:transposase